MSLRELIKKHAKTRQELYDGLQDFWYEHKQEEWKKEENEKWVSDEALKEFSLAKEHSVRNLLLRLEKNEAQYQTSKEDFNIGDNMCSYLDGRIRESEIIRLELEKIFGEAFSEKGSLGLEEKKND